VIKTLQSNNCPVYFGPVGQSPLHKFLSSAENKKAKKFILVDEHTLDSCFPRIAEQVDALKNAEIIEIESGENNKNIEICSRIWEALSELKADRNSIFINLGGGVIGDMGGFIASTYKRGIRFIQVPTTLLAQVDASVGGKVAIDLGGIKNLVGLFSQPQAVYIDPGFLITLSKREMLSGFAEMIKHGLIADKNYWEKLKKTGLEQIEQYTDLIYRSVEIKNEIVIEDPLEKGKRKLLNFGHTIGHAVEALSLEGGRKALTHGEAIAIGILCESRLSHRKKNLPETELSEINSFITSLFPFYTIDEMDFHRLIEIMRNDKKNQNDSINFTLLKAIGDPVFDCSCTADEIKESLRYYTSLKLK